MGESASTTTSRPSAARATASPMNGARGAIILRSIPSLPDRPRGSPRSSFPMPIDHHRVVREDLICIGENRPPGRRAPLEHSLESPIGQNVINAGSPEFAGPPLIAPVGALLE